MNANTGTTLTQYYFSTLSEKQLLKTADFYLDSVFHPQVLSDKSIFDNEAWRYALASTDSELSMRKALGVKGSHHCSITVLPIRYDARLAALDTETAATCIRGRIILQSDEDVLKPQLAQQKMFYSYLKGLPTLQEKVNISRMGVGRGSNLFTASVSYPEKQDYGAMNGHLKSCYIIPETQTGSLGVEIASFGDKFFFVVFQGFDDDRYAEELMHQLEEEGITCMAALAASVLLFGCGKKAATTATVATTPAQTTGTAPKAQNPTKAATEITFLNSKGEIQEALEKMAAAYGKETGNKVTIIACGAGEVPYTKITTMYNSGNAPTLAMEKLHYQPNGIARALSTKTFPFVGVIIPTLRNPYFANLVASIERYAMLMKLHLITEPLHMIYNNGSVILVLVYMYLPFAILPLFTTIDKFDFSLIDAARDLGATKPQSMSTADSQLLVASSAFAEDLYKTFIRKKANDKEVLLVSRIAVIAITIIAIFLALDENSSVFKIVSYAWAGFGATFGPAILASVFWKKATRKGCIAGMQCGTVAMVVSRLHQNRPAGIRNDGTERMITRHFRLVGYTHGFIEKPYVLCCGFIFPYGTHNESVPKSY